MISVADTSAKYSEASKDDKITFDEFVAAYGTEEWLIVQVIYQSHCRAPLCIGTRACSLYHSVYSSCRRVRTS